jgi:hypothetical protein
MKVGWLVYSVVTTLLIITCRGKVEEGTVQKATEESSDGLDETKADAPWRSPYMAIELSSVGAVRGTVRLTGAAPELDVVLVSKDQDVCGPHVPNPSLRLGPGGAVENAVVSLVGITRGKELRPLGRVSELEIVKCMAVPHIQIVPAGSMLEIYNSDPLLHDVYAYAGKTDLLFSVALPVQHFRAQQKLEREGIIHITCQAGHPWMSGYIVVQEHPYYALTSPRGTYSIADVPPGSYRLRVWHELLGQKEAPLTVEVGATATVDFELEAPGK